jgi:hypothetical protein
MIGLAAQGEKNDVGQSQVQFPGQSILTASRRHDDFWRLADFPSRVSSPARKDAAREPEAGFAAQTHTHTGWDHEYTSETWNKVY